MYGSLQNVKGSGAITRKILAIKATTPPIIDRVGGYRDGSWIVYVPDEALSAYKNHEFWGADSKIIDVKPFSELPDNYKEMGTIEN